MSSRLRAPRAVLFDVGNTLLEELRFNLVEGLAAVIGNGSEVAALADAFRADLASCHRHERELLLAAWLCDRVPALASTAVPVVEDAIWPAVVTLAPRFGVAEVLNRLADDDVPLAAVSNAAFSGRVLRTELARHGLADQLRFVLSSADVSTRKPNAAIFQAAVARLGVAADRTWFVGDTLEEDIAGAMRAGLQPIWLSGGAVSGPEFTGVYSVKDWAEFTRLYEASNQFSL